MHLLHMRYWHFPPVLPRGRRGKYTMSPTTRMISTMKTLMMTLTYEHTAVPNVSCRDRGRRKWALVAQGQCFSALSSERVHVDTCVETNQPIIYNTYLGKTMSCHTKCWFTTARRAKEAARVLDGTHRHRDRDGITDTHTTTTLHLGIGRNAYTGDVGF